MEIDKLFEKNSIDSVADNVFGVVNNSVSEVREMQRKKVAENVQLIVNALKKIEEDIREKYDSVSSNLEKRIISIKDGRDGINGRDGKDGKDGKPGKDGRPGRDGKDGKNGLNGVDGQDGVSVVNAHIDFDGSLIISLSSGIEINVGEVIAPSLAEQIKVITNGGGTSQSVLDTLTSLQSQIDALSGATIYKGLWNASTNSPALTSGVGTSGNFYIVSVAGSTSLDGITNWGVGDWAIFNGSVWQRVEGGAAGNFTTVTASSLTSGRVTYAGAGGLLQDSSNLTFNGTTLTSTGFSGPLNGAIGGSTPAAGAFTTLSATENATITKAGSDTIASGPYFGLNSGGGTFAAFQLGASNTGDFWINGGSGWQRVMQMRQDYRLDVFSGLSVTGALSATTSVALTRSVNGAAVSTVSNTNAGANAAASRYFTNDAGTYEISAFSNASAFAGDLILNIVNGKGYQILHNGSQVGRWTSTGLSVTGALSATGVIRGTFFDSAVIYGGADNDNFTAVYGTSHPSLPNQWEVTLDGANRARITTTGLSVTGTLSSTGNFTVNTDRVVLTASAPANSLYLNGSGNLGLGTASPSTKLHLQDNSAVYIQMTDVGDGASRVGQNGTALTFGVDGADGSTERMRISSSGNVGINTASPGSTLDVKGTLRLSGSTSGYVGLAPAAAAGSTTYTLPSADGTSGQVLSTNGSGTLSWATGITTTTGSPAYYGARAWVNFNGTGTVAIRASVNVTSITDNGTGDYTVNITTALADANYAVTGEAGGTAGVASLGLADQTTARTTTAFRLYVFTTGGVLADGAQVNIAVFR